MVFFIINIHCTVKFIYQLGFLFFAACTFKVKTLKKKAQSYTAITVKNPQGKVTYSVKYANGKAKKALKFSKGKLTVKKKTKKGTYKVTVTVKVAGNDQYKAKTVNKKITVKVK